MTRREYDALKAKAAGDAPAGDGPTVDSRGFKTVEGMEDIDTNGDGHISKGEMDMHLEFKRKELEDADAMRDAQRKMAWFSLFGMLLYPFSVVLASLAGLDRSTINTRINGTNILCSSSRYCSRVLWCSSI